MVQNRKIPLFTSCPNAAPNSERINTGFVGGVIPFQADIGEGTTIGYQGIGVVIHKRCVIGKNCHIAQNVTIGGTGGFYKVPVVGDNVDIGAGANIIGPIHIGNNVTIGAGAVVIKDLPDNCVAVGVPAKIIKIKEQNTK